MSLGIRLPSYRLAVAGLLASLMLGNADGDAQAKPARKQAQQTQQARPVHGPGYRPPYAAIVMDDKTGQVLHEDKPDEPRHPASLTKIMTLYLLFEQLEAGKFNLDTPLPISAHAAVQRPTKLGLKAGQTLKVEEAIKGLVTRSANDASVVIAEAIGGTEPDFAKIMTLKARILGMTNTTYINASGLPAEDQITTARDQALLGRAIQHRFPLYYRYFATASFQWRGKDIRNHNGLLGNVKGVDGIKTGYTDASGYNLVSSVRRDDKHIVAVVLGGKSNGARDARMRELIEQNISHASGQRTEPAFVEAGDAALIYVDIAMPAAKPAAPALAAESSTPVPSPRPEGAATVAPEPATATNTKKTKASQTNAKTQSQPAKVAPAERHPARRARRPATSDKSAEVPNGWQAAFGAPAARD